MRACDEEAMTALHQFIRGQLDAEGLRQVGIAMQQAAGIEDTPLARHRRRNGFALAALAITTDRSKLPIMPV